MNEPLRQKKPRLEDAKYLAAIRLLPCCVCGREPPTQAAHIRIGNSDYGKRTTGLQEKPDDRWAVPLCGPVMYTIGAPLQGCHAEQHSMNEEEFWKKHRKNPLQIANFLYKKLGSDEKRRSKYRGRKAGGADPSGAVSRQTRPIEAKQSRPSKKNRTTISTKGFGKVIRPFPSKPFPKGKRKITNRAATRSKPPRPV